jgi:pimeloyl-ACP methyl ester carboxylesterase
MNAVDKTIELPGRTRLAYCEHGDENGTPVIALHGVTDSHRSFDPLLPYLPRSLRWLSLTQRGHGDSGRPEAGYRPSDFAGDVAAFMDALGLRRAIVLGHSMGANNALRFALDHPSRLWGLVLAGATPAFARNLDVIEFWRREIAVLVDPIPPSFAEEFQRSTLAQPVAPEFLQKVVGESLKVPARVWRAAFDGFMRDDFSDELPAIEVPTLIVWGRHDAYCRRQDQQALCAAIAGSRLVVYDDAGHTPHWEEPRRFANDVAAFAFRTREETSAALA